MNKQYARGLALAVYLAAASGVASAVDFSDSDCVIEPNITVDLSTSVDGIVEEIFVDRGDIVKKDDVLVHLLHPVLGQREFAALADLDQGLF